MMVDTNVIIFFGFWGSVAAVAIRWIYPNFWGIVFRRLFGMSSPTFETMSGCASECQGKTRRMIRMQEELDEAKSKIQYLEKKLEQKGSGDQLVRAHLKIELLLEKFENRFGLERELETKIEHLMTLRCNQRRAEHETGRNKGQI